MMRLLLIAAFFLTSAVSLAGTVPVHRLAEQAEAMARRGEYTEALATAHTALAEDPAYIRLWRAKAAAHLGLEEYDEAGKALAVCLIDDPHDIEANFLAMVNDMRSPGAPRTAGSGRGHLLENDEFADVLALFLARRDLHELLQPLIMGWRRSNTPLDGAKKVIQHYAANRLEDAANEHADSRLPARLSDTLRDLLHRAASGTGGWKVERGGLYRDSSRLSMHAKAGGEAFAWLTVSKHWTGITAEVDLADSFVEPVDIFFRYSSPSSYIRIRIDNKSVAVHERVPDGGLSLIHEKLRLHLPEQKLNIVLKGRSLGLYSGGRLLSTDKIPVSEKIESGFVAISCGKQDSEGETTTALTMTVTALPDTWETLDHNIDDETLQQRYQALRTTGFILTIVDGEGGPRLTQKLLGAGRHGIAAYARLPRGDFDFKKIYQCATNLPPQVAEGLWTGVIFELGSAGDLDRFAAAEIEARKNGLEIALMLDAETAAELADAGASPRTDWLLMRDSDEWPTKTLRECDVRHLWVLYGVTDDGRIYSSLMR